MYIDCCYNKKTCSYIAAFPICFDHFSLNVYMQVIIQQLHPTSALHTSIREMRSQQQELPKNLKKHHHGLLSASPLETPTNPLIRSLILNPQSSTLISKQNPGHLNKFLGVLPVHFRNI